MYYPWGWPKILKIPQKSPQLIRHVVANRERVLFACITEDSIGIWYSKPSVLIVNHKRSKDSIDQLGINTFAVWKLDSSALAVVTSVGHILFYDVTVDKVKNRSLLVQVDSKVPSLQRESAELYIKSIIPAITISLAFQIKVPGGISSIVGLKNELMVATEVGHIERYEWNGRVDLDCCLELSRIPFYVDQQDSRGVLLGNEQNSSSNYVIDLEYSPILGGFAVVLANGRAALLTAPALKFKPSELKGLWAQEVVDAVCTAVNHKYLLIAYGRRNGQTVVCHIDEITGGLQISHQLLLSSKDYPDASSLGAVCSAKWTPDSCALLVTWKSGGMGMWSVYGALLWCSLGWDYQSASVIGGNCIQMKCIEWGAEGYQLWTTIEQKIASSQQLNQLAQLTFLKSSLTVNPCMSNHGHVVLQTDDRLYINSNSATTTSVWRQRIKSNVYDVSCDVDEVEQDRLLHSSSNSLLANKQWIVVMIPSAYSNTNWPIRYVAVDKSGKFLAVAGRTGVAHCCLQTKKWKLFGNETQEKDFVVTGGLLWWQDHLILGCYNIHDDRDEIRLYPRESKLDNSHVRTVLVSAPVLLLNNHKNRLLAFFADNHIGVFIITILNGVVDIMKEQSIDVSNLSVHPVCVSHVVLVSRMEEQITSQQTSSTSSHVNSRRHQVKNILVNVCGRVIMFQLTNNDINSNSRKAADNESPIYVNPTVLASNVESIWVCDRWSKERRQLVESLLFGCGAQGMKVWLPLFLADSEKTRHFMSKWIMLPINVNVYPLSVLFEDAVIFGVECDTLLMASDPTKNDHFSHPFCVVEKTSQVYLHHILRQLLRRNLGNHAWEIARSCQTLSHFPHALELLLHEVLEDEATSKEPIPDALLPRAVEFIREFPVYLKTVVQCARKIEIALWSHLFAVVDKPQNLFQECLRKRQLTTGASYLLILQNLESSSVSRQYATKLLDASLDQGEWQLCKDLVRFLRAIDPSDVDSPPRNSFVSNPAAKFPMAHPTPPLSPNNDDISFVLGTMQVPRARTYSVPTANTAAMKDLGTKTEPKNIPIRRKSGEMKDGQEFFIDVILKRHARKLLDNCRLLDLGKFAAHLDFHLVSWLRKERSRAAMVHDFVPTLKKIHQDFQWPYPVLPSSFTSFYLQNKDQQNLPLIDSGAHEQVARDSGFLSHSSVMDINKDLNTGGVRTMEAQLRPRTVSAEDESVRTLDLSEDSSIWGEGEQGLLDEPTTLWSNGSGIQFNSEIEQMSAELASKGSRESEVQLRYLLQLMLEANCLEWAVLIAVVLRDAMAVIRIVNAARASDISPDIIQRLKDGLATLEAWADKECLGYKRFMHTIRNQSNALSKITLRMKSPSPSIEAEDLDTPTSSIDDSNRISYVNDVDLDDMNELEDDSEEDEQLSERMSNEMMKDEIKVNSSLTTEHNTTTDDNKSSIECSIS